MRITRRTSLRRLIRLHSLAWLGNFSTLSRNPARLYGVVIIMEKINSSALDNFISVIDRGA